MKTHIIPFFLIFPFLVLASRSLEAEQSSREDDYLDYPLSHENYLDYPTQKDYLDYPLSHENYLDYPTQKDYLDYPLSHENYLDYPTQKDYLDYPLSHENYLDYPTQKDYLDYPSLPTSTSTNSADRNHTHVPSPEKDIADNALDKPEAALDLEEKAQDFILETKKINIPGYPDAFNPSITRWNGALLMSFRIYDRKVCSTHRIGLIYLDENLEPVGSPYILDMRFEDPLSFMKRQDPRLITLGQRLYIVYNNVLKGTEKIDIRRMFVAEVLFDGEKFFAESTQHLTSYPRETINRSEKNWVPFDYKGALLLAYSLSPHRIFFPLTGTNQCAAFALSSETLPWNWGVLRGGTPALLEGEEYLAFFHSCMNMKTVHSKGSNILHYFMGAYTFSKEPPFTITHISPEPIVGKYFYHGTAYKTWKPVQAVFPGGFFSDDQYIWIAYGRQDHEIWIAKLDKRQLLGSLVPVIPPPL